VVRELARSPLFSDASKKRATRCSTLTRERGIGIIVLDVYNPVQWGVVNSRSRSGGIGRRARFRTWFPLREWRFESSLRQYVLQANLKRTLWLCLLHRGLSPHARRGDYRPGD